MLRFNYFHVLLCGFTLVMIILLNSTAYCMDPSDYDIDILRSFLSPGPSPQGLAWDGEYLWVSDDSTDTIYSINHLNGSINSSFSSPGSEPKGITYDGMYLWNIDNNARKIFKLNPEDGSVINFLELPEEYPFTGLTWDGTYLWSAYLAGWSSRVVRIDPVNGNIDTSFYCDAEGLAFDGTYLWNVDSQNGNSVGFVKKRELPSGTVISCFRIPVYYPTGLTFDGTYLWLAYKDTDTIYQMDVISVGVEKSFENHNDTPENFVLHQNNPNPFNSLTTIKYTIYIPSNVTLAIFDVTGREVIQLTNQRQSAGQYSVIWDGKDKHGRDMSSSLYIFRLKSCSLCDTKTMMLVR